MIVQVGMGGGGDREFRPQPLGVWQFDLLYADVDSLPERIKGSACNQIDLSG